MVEEHNFPASLIRTLGKRFRHAIIESLLLIISPKSLGLMRDVKHLLHHIETIFCKCWRQLYRRDYELVSTLSITTTCWSPFYALDWGSWRFLLFTRIPLMSLDKNTRSKYDSCFHWFYLIIMKIVFVLGGNGILMYAYEVWLESSLMEAVIN